MSYAPGTTLSIGSGETLEQVTVLTENKVATKMFAGKPVSRRDIMSLDDWKLLAGNQEISSASSSTSPSSSTAASSSTSTSPDTYPINTILRWKDVASKSSRTAIVIKNGVLQLKEVINDKVTFDFLRRCAKKNFASVAEWKASLSGGELTVTAGPPTIEDRISTPIVAKTDAQYIDEIKKRFQVRSDIYLDASDVEKRDHCIRDIKYSLTSLQTRVAELDASNASDAYDKLRGINRMGRSIAHNAKIAMYFDQNIRYEPVKAAQKKYMFRNEYRQAIYAFVGGKMVHITSGNGLVGIVNHNYRCHAAAATTGTFAELGLDMNGGKPRLQVAYRKKMIDL